MMFTHELVGDEEGRKAIKGVSIGVGLALPLWAPIMYAIIILVR